MQKISQQSEAPMQLQLRQICEIWYMHMFESLDHDEKGA